MDLNYLHPIAENHAIQNVVIAITWSEELGASVMTEALKLKNKFLNAGLPFHQNQQGFEINANLKEDSFARQPFNFGIVFCEFDPKLPNQGRTVTINRANCTISISDYTRWEDCYKDIQNYLKIVFSLVGSLKPIRELILQYTDLFSWKSDPDEIDFSLIFKRNSFVPDRAFLHKHLWHTHNGYLEIKNSPINHSLLNNINVDIGDKNGERLIQIVGLHKAILETPIWNSNGKNDDVIAQIFDSLHNENKNALSSILTDALLNKINLSN